MFDINFAVSDAALHENANNAPISFPTCLDHVVVSVLIVESKIIRDALKLGNLAICLTQHLFDMFFVFRYSIPSTISSSGVENTMSLMFSSAVSLLPSSLSNCTLNAACDKARYTTLSGWYRFNELRYRTNCPNARSNAAMSNLPRELLISTAIFRPSRSAAIGSCCSAPKSIQFGLTVAQQHWVVRNRPTIFDEGVFAGFVKRVLCHFAFSLPQGTKIT